MDSIIEQLNANLKIVYRQALDADKKLDELQQQGHGKFKALYCMADIIRGLHLKVRFVI